jgi:hypothetical protein
MVVVAQPMKVMVARVLVLVAQVRLFCAMRAHRNSPVA